MYTFVCPSLICVVCLHADAPGPASTSCSNALHIHLNRMLARSNTPHLHNLMSALQTMTFTLDACSHAVCLLSGRRQTGGNPAPDDCSGLPEAGRQQPQACGRRHTAPHAHTPIGVAPCAVSATALGHTRLVSDASPSSSSRLCKGRAAKDYYEVEILFISHQAGFRRFSFFFLLA